MAKNTFHEAYELIKTEKLEDLNADGFLLRHKKTGANIVLVSNDDDNKVFYIGFRTPPKDSTGVAHIIEHTVLCGSKKYPVKDPFVELVKGSLNTFLNAMTYPDKTVYPVASCNDVDFKNLMDIYLDAVLNPNIYEHEEIFRQEGWHYELSDKNAELTINGVVYNEMKGAFSSPESVLERASLNSLYPDTTYAIESGGDPKNIPELTYEDYLDFHRRFYHPSNSYIYLYGDMDMTERLDYLDKEYLCNYDAIQIDSEITAQQHFSEPVRIEMTYPISADEEEDNQTYLAYNVSCGTSLDDMLYQAMDILEYALTGTNGAPLKKALTDAGIGEDNYGSFESGIYQPFFSIVSHGANPCDADRFMQIIRDVLREQVEKGLDKKALYAAINSAQFKYREADFGSFPKGLIYGLQIFDSWLYDSDSPFLHLHGSVVLDRLKALVEEGYFENLIQTYLLDNTHSSFLVVKPEKGKLVEDEQRLKDKLAQYKACLTDEQLDVLIEQTQHLKDYQSAPDAEEDLLKIPILSRKDLNKKARPFHYSVRKIDGVDCIHTDVFTNGIHYIGLSFKVDTLSLEEISYMSCLLKSIGAMDTENYSYNDLANEINLHTGGISAAPHIYICPDGSYQLTADISLKYLESDMAAAFDLLDEVLFKASFADGKHLKELLAMDKVRIETHMSQAGHSVASGRALSYMSEPGLLAEYFSGLEFYRFERDLLADFDNRYDAFTEKMHTLAEKIFRKENLVIDITGDTDCYNKVSARLTRLMEGLYTGDYEALPLCAVPQKGNEGLKNASQIQYVARTGNFAKAGYSYTGLLSILKVILGYDYFWMNIRVKGGAYGCMCNFKRSGELTFVSYRDPNLTATNDVFEATGDYLRDFDADEREMTKYIIGTISNIDTPMTASQQGERNVTSYFSGITYEMIQKERDSILTAQPADIRALADLVDACMAQGYICVVGNENAIEENRELFYKVETLIQ